jgi:hypothetical protein
MHDINRAIDISGISFSAYISELENRLESKIPIQM